MRHCRPVEQGQCQVREAKTPMFSRRSQPGIVQRGQVCAFVPGLCVFVHRESIAASAGTSCPAWKAPRERRRSNHVRGRSRLRYCMASARWRDWITALPSRSAMVRAILTIRVKPRAERPSRMLAAASRRWQAGSRIAWRRRSAALMRALVQERDRANLARCISRAALTRSRTAAECSPWLCSTSRS